MSDGSTIRWAFRPFTVKGRTFYPNTWSIERVNGIAIILDGDGNLIDEPDDTGQSDFTLILWGIGWLHAHLATEA
jgi:hypothetical protein